MEKPSESASKLVKMIEKAIEDGELSNKEYDQILGQADADGVIDPQERNLLTQLQDLLANRTVKRVP
jgi:tellurite resistance protein